MNIDNRPYTRWLAAIVMAAGLGAAIIGGSAVASADTGSDISAPGSTSIATGPVEDGATSKVSKLEAITFKQVSAASSPTFGGGPVLQEQYGVKVTHPTTQPTQPK